MITMGIGSPNRLLTFGLPNSKVIRVYMGYSDVQLPLPDMFKDAYKEVVGETQKSHHKAAFKACRFITDGETMIRWINPDTDIALGEMRFELKGEDWRYVRQYIMTAFAELLTNAYYKLQEGDINGCKELERELKTTQEKLLNNEFNDKLYCAIDLYINVETKRYNCGVCVHEKY